MDYDDDFFLIKINFRNIFFYFPKKKEIFFIFFTMLICFIFSEILTRLWLNHFASQEDYEKYVLFEKADKYKRKYTCAYKKKSSPSERVIRKTGCD